MHVDFFDWDDESSELGNTQHVADHGVIRAEFEETIASLKKRDVRPSNTDKDNVTAIGLTKGGRRLRVVFELDDDDEDFIYVRPVTAYDPEPG